MKNLFRMSLFALLLTALGFAQQEINPDRFEGDGAKQPIKAKQMVMRRSAKNRASAKPVKKTTLSARAVGGN